MSLFSAKPPAPPALQPSTFGSAFGSTQQSQPFSSAANGTANTQTSSGGTPSTSTNPNPSTFRPEFSKSGTTAPSLPAQITPDASSNRILKDLLDSAHNLPKLQHGNIGSINLTLNELRKETLELCKHDNGANHTKAHYLLSKSGVNASDFETELEALPHTRSGADAVESGSQTYVQNHSTGEEREDIDNYLGAKKDETILSAIEQSLGSAARDFDKFINLNVAIDWKVRKDNLKRQLGIPVRNKITREDLEKSFTWNKALPGTFRVLEPLAAAKTTAGSMRQVPREKFEGTARVIYALNESRLENKCFPVCLNFENLYKGSADTKSRQMSEIWRILADLTDEKTARVSQEQLFFELYQNQVPRNALRKQIVKHAKLTLEKQFYNYMDEIYTKDDQKPPEYQPATNINKVSYFIQKVITKNNDSDLLLRTLSYNGVPIWALVYYLMRSGLYEEAVVLTLANKEAFNKFDKNFPVYMSHFAKLGCFDLPSELHERIAADYGQNFQFLSEDATNFDPYKYAVYKIIGKCDLVKKSLPGALNLSIEDWLWFHLLILNEFNAAESSDLLYENYRLESLQKKVVCSGPARFNASSNHPVYAKTLVMLGLYELAVQYVYQNISECDAVHLAIGLSYYGLLKSAKSNSDDLLVVDPNESYQINFSRLLGSYTRNFKISDPKVAAQYLIVICLSKGGKNVEETTKCHDALRELILISREFGLILGDLNPDTGDKIPGILEHQRALINLPDIKRFYSQITERSAQRFEEEGRSFDALRLYQLCQEYDTVVSLLNKFLSELLSMTELDRPLLTGATFITPEGVSQPIETSENNIILLARKLKGVFDKNSFISGKISAKEKEINEYLLQMVEIREKFVRRDWQGALDGVRELGLIPFVSTDDFVEIRRAAESLNSLDVKLVKVIPSVLIIVMTSISQIKYQATSKQFGIEGQERGELKKWRTIAKSCMIYAGMIQYRMPRETYSLLNNLESLL